VHLCHYHPEMHTEPFAVAVPDAVLDDLRARIRRTRWPDPAPGEPWSQGADLDYLRGLLAYWADGFDWRARERQLNRYEHHVAEVDGVRVHFVRHRAAGGGVPLILSHGWPSTFVELLGLVDRLGDQFDLVVPSLPGYAFSQRPPRTGVDRAFVARLWHRLMQGLGYERYGAHGGDFGAGIATQMALTQPDRMIGIHLSTPEIWPYIGPGAPPLSAAEQAYIDHVNRWDETERGYSAVQSTRPQTLGYALNDSPAGLAAWVLDKWRSWSDSGGDLDARFGRDALLTMLTIWWATGSITSSMRDYYDNRWHGTPIGPADVVRVPTAMAVFANEFVPEGEPPRSWYERLYQIRRWTVFPRGGHFAAAEEPDVLADDIAEFFADLRRR
jgi:pimeloyl-ACP methyl ester carboxylesterase